MKLSMRRIFILSTFVLSKSFASCTAIIIGSYGIKAPGEKSIEDIEKYTTKYGIPLGKFMCPTAVIVT